MMYGSVSVAENNNNKQTNKQAKQINKPKQDVGKKRFVGF